jgi:membrane-associated protease RseP (regulator of RpoE activity)
VRDLIAASLACALLGVGCGPKVRPDYPEPEDYDDPMALMPDAGPQAARLQPPPIERRAAGQVTRAELNGVLQAGIGAFLSGVEVEPAFVSDKFFGWEIVSFWADEPRFARVDLIPGDVVKSVNGRAVERPEQLQELWQALATATSIDVQVFRDGMLHELRYVVVP